MDVNVVSRLSSNRSLRMVISTASAIVNVSCAASVVPPLVTSTVNLDGHAIRIVTAGVEIRRPGMPVVVFESGGGTALETWDPILPQVASFSPLVAYDRSGTGESEWDGEPPTPERIVARLHRLLGELGIGPPYVLVGHSWGGALVRYFAGAYPDEIAGILYLDPTDVTLSPAEELEVYNSIGAGAAGRDALYSLMEQSLSGALPPVRAEAEVILGLARAELDARGLRPVPPVPASVILAGKPPVLPRTLLPFDTEAYARAALAQRARGLQAWVNYAGAGRFLVAEDAGHFVHADEPELVLSVIRELVEAAK